MPFMTRHRNCAHTTTCCMEVMSPACVALQSKRKLLTRSASKTSCCNFASRITLTQTACTICSFQIHICRLGLGHTFSNAAAGDSGCQKSADYKNQNEVETTGSDAVRDTTPQPVFTATDPFISCTANGILDGTGANAVQMCTSAKGNFPPGDNYYANWGNVMVSTCWQGPSCATQVVLTSGMQFTGAIIQ